MTNHNGPLTMLGFPVRASAVIPDGAIVLSDGPLVWVELRELRAEVERLRAALIEATAEALYSDRVPDGFDRGAAILDLRKRGLLPTE